MIQSGCFGYSVFFRCECLECIPVCGYPHPTALRASRCPACVLPGAFHIGLRKFVRCRSQAPNLCTSLNVRCPSGVRLWPTLSGCLHLVGVNVAIYSTGDGKGTENIKRAYGLNGIFSVPVFDLWRH